MYVGRCVYVSDEPTSMNTARHRHVFPARARKLSLCNARSERFYAVTFVMKSDQQNCVTTYAIIERAAITRPGKPKIMGYQMVSIKLISDFMHLTRARASAAIAPAAIAWELRCI